MPARGVDEVARTKSDAALNHFETVDERVQAHGERLAAVETRHADLASDIQEIKATVQDIKAAVEKGTNGGLASAVLDLLKRPKDLALVASSLAMIGGFIASLGFGAARAVVPDPTDAELARALAAYAQRTAVRDDKHGGLDELPPEPDTDAP